MTTPYRPVAPRLPRGIPRLPKLKALPKVSYGDFHPKVRMADAPLPEAVPTEEPLWSKILSKVMWLDDSFWRTAARAHGYDDIDSSFEFWRGFTESMLVGYLNLSPDSKFTKTASWLGGMTVSGPFQISTYLGAGTGTAAKAGTKAERLTALTTKASTAMKRLRAAERLAPPAARAALAARASLAEAKSVAYGAKLANVVNSMKMAYPAAKGSVLGNAIRLGLSGVKLAGRVVSGSIYAKPLQERVIQPSVNFIAKTLPRTLRFLTTPIRIGKVIKFPLIATGKGLARLAQYPGKIGEAGRLYIRAAKWFARNITATTEMSAKMIRFQRNGNHIAHTAELVNNFEEALHIKNANAAERALKEFGENIKLLYGESAVKELAGMPKTFRAGVEGLSALPNIGEVLPKLAEAKDKQAFLQSLPISNEARQVAAAYSADLSERLADKGLMRLQEQAFAFIRPGLSPGEQYALSRAMKSKKGPLTYAEVAVAINLPKKVAEIVKKSNDMMTEMSKALEASVTGKNANAMMVAANHIAKDVAELKRIKSILEEWMATLRATGAQDAGIGKTVRDIDTAVRRAEKRVNDVMRRVAKAVPAEYEAMQKVRTATRKDVIRRAHYKMNKLERAIRRYDIRWEQTSKALERVQKGSRQYKSLAKTLKYYERLRKSAMAKRSALIAKMNKIKGEAARNVKAHMKRYAEMQQDIKNIMTKTPPAAKETLQDLIGMPSGVGARYTVRQANKAIKSFPVAFSSPRIGYAPKIYGHEAREYMSKNNLWDAWAGNLGEMLKKNPGGLPEEEVNFVLEEAAQTIGKSKKRGFGEYARLLITKHMTASEINEAAWKAGLPKDMKLAATAPGIVHGTKAVRREKILMVRGLELEGLKATGEKPELIKLNADFQGVLANAEKARVLGAPVARYHDIVEGAGKLQGQYLMKFGAHGWKIVDDDIALTVAGFRDAVLRAPYSKGLKGALLKTYDRIQRGLQSLALHYTPGVYHVLNLVGDNSRMLIGLGGLDNTIHGYQLLDTLYDTGKVSIRFPHGTVDFSVEAINALLAQAGKASSFFSPRGIMEVGEFGYVPSLSHKVNIVKKASMYVGRILENQRAQATFLELLYQNRHFPYEEAVKRAGQGVRDILFAYGERTPFQRAYSGRIFFFDTFKQNSIKFFLRNVLERPLAMYVQLKVLKRLQQTGTKEAREMMPAFLKERGGFPLAQAGKMVTYATGVPIDMYGVLQQLTPSTAWRELGASLNPIPRILLEVRRGKTFYMNADLKQWQKLSSPAVAKAFEAIDPIFRKLLNQGIIRQYEDAAGKKSWAIPGWLMIAMQQVRPLNMLVKVLSTEMKNKVLWPTIGFRTYERDIEEEKLRSQREQVEKAVAAMPDVFTPTETKVYKKEAQLAPDEEERVRKLRGMLRTLRRKAVSFKRRRAAGD